jgi:hypothetical protein
VTRSTIVGAMQIGTALILLGAEAYVGALSLFFPRVGSNYADYFIHHSVGCLVPEDIDPERLMQDLPDVISIPTLRWPLTCVLLPSGWSEIESWGVWSVGDVATLMVPLRETDSSVELTLRGFAPGIGRQRVIIEVNEGSSVVANVPDGADMKVVLPAPHAHRVRLSMHIARPASPRSLGRTLPII